MISETDVVIIGTGVAGLYCALNLPEDKKITLVTKSTIEMSDSYLAQGGICVLKQEDDFSSFYEDTMKAGHYENNPASVTKMIRKSSQVISDLICYGVEFERRDGKLLYTKEGAHSTSRILYHKDITGREITEKLINQVKGRSNITILEDTEMLDLICSNNNCNGVILRTKEDSIIRIDASYTVLATGGIGGLYQDSTNYPHLTGDSIALAIKHRIALKNLNYIQIHPTTLYSKTPGRRFLISESVRGEGGYLLNAKKERFVDELLPRDLLTQKILEQMTKDKSRHVWLSLTHLSSDMIVRRFPNIYQRCLEEGIDITKELIPVTPAQHYFMGGIEVDQNSKTSMERLYAIGETSCNGVHGANRLASNSLLESLVFGKEAALQISSTFTYNKDTKSFVDFKSYEDVKQLRRKHREIVLKEIERVNQHEQRNNIKIKCG